MVESKVGPRTFEELLMGRIGKLYEAKEAGDDYLFDEVLDEVEGLFGLVPELYTIFSRQKEELNVMATQNMKQLATQMSLIEDEITRRVIDTQKKATIKWEYRTDMLDLILSLVNEYQMIPFANPFAGEMALGEYAQEEEPVPFEPIVEETLDEELPEQPPNPQQVAEPPEQPPMQEPIQQLPLTPPPLPLQQAPPPTELPKQQPQSQPPPPPPTLQQQPPQPTGQPQLRKKIRFGKPRTYK